MQTIKLFRSGLFSAVTAMFLLPAGPAFAQEANRANKENYVLQGKVADAETGQEIPFANILVYAKGRTLGWAATDANGNFKVILAPKKLKGTGKELEVRAYLAGYTNAILGHAVVYKPWRANQNHLRQ